jgi:prolyl oligopeptidase
LDVGKNTSIGELTGLGDNDLLFLQSTPVKSYQYETYSYTQNNVQPVPFGKRAVDNSGEFSSEVLWIPSRDGKRIPVTVLYTTKFGLKGNHPVLIEAYGNSGASQDMHFNPSWFSWIKRGGVYAYAHVRGGGELGEDWYLDGQYPHKMNSVNDVVDVAEWLENNNYSSASKMFVMGGSAGTFLVGGAVNQRPDLFAGGIFLAGLPDLATHTDAAGGREEKSIGPKDTSEGFKSNYEMSSVYHVPKGKTLPSMLIIHGATDYILALHPVARYAATLQERQEGDNPILFLTDWESGHSGGGADNFYITKFILWQSGHPDFQPKK